MQELPAWASCMNAELSSPYRCLFLAQVDVSWLGSEARLPHSAWLFSLFGEGVDPDHGAKVWRRRATPPTHAHPYGPRRAAPGAVTITSSISSLIAENASVFSCSNDPTRSNIHCVDCWQKAEDE